VGELGSVLDALAAEDLDGLVAPQLLGRTALLVWARNRIEAELTRTVRRADVVQAAEHDGLTSMASWLRGHVRLSAGEVRRLVRNGRALDQLPVLRAAFAAGSVTAEQVAVVAPVAAVEVQAEAVGQGVDLAEVDGTLTEVATTRPFAQLPRVVGYFLARLDPDGPEPDPTEGRSLTLSRLLDGRLAIRGELDAVGGEKLQAALESIVQANRPKGDLRTRAQQLGDALVQLVDNELGRAGCRSCGPSSRICWSPSASRICSTRPPDRPLPRPGSARSSPPPGPAGRPATGRSPGSPSARRGSRWTWGAPSGWSRPTCGGRSRPATGTACSPAARHPVTGATSTMSSNGSWTRGRRRWRTPRCCASGTTRRSITASESSNHPTADGAPTAPTAPRSSSPKPCSSSDRSRSRGERAAQRGGITEEAFVVTVRDVIILAAVVASVLLAGLAVFQLLLVAGRPLGRLAWGGQHEVLPPPLRVGSAVSVLSYAAIAWLLWRAVAQPGDDGPWMWVLTAFFGVGVLMNAASRSRPERLVMTPIVLVLAISCLLIALG